MFCFCQPHMGENHKLAREGNMRRKYTAFLVKSVEKQVLRGGVCIATQPEFKGERSTE